MKGSAGSPGGPATQAARLSYLMLFRVGLVTLLLGILFVAELVQPESLAGDSTGAQHALLVAVVAAYGLTLVYAIAIRYVKRLDRFAALQVVLDLCGVSALVLYTGAPDSTFSFAYLLVIVGASIVLPPRGILLVAAGALLLYLSVSLAGWNGLPEESLLQRPTLHAILRPLGLNVVALLAVTALASRLAAELQRASERIDSQRLSLHELTTLHREVIQSLQSGLISVDLEGLIATINTAAAEILGVRQKEAVGHGVRDLLPGIEDYLTSADLGAIAARLELCVRVRGSAGPEERILGVTVSRLMNHREQLIGRLINFQDLTVLRHAEESARQADRLAAIGRMAATVAHEIRNPLAAICGSIELLAQMLPAEAGGEANDLMQIVVREGRRLDGLISELLSYANPRPLMRTKVELGPTISQMAQVFEYDRRLGTARLRILRADPAVVEADPNRLQQVMWNVLRNAAEANPGGDIDVSVVADQDRSRAQVIVRDYGPGLTEEGLAHVFEPFYTTKDTGTGLGLALVHRVVEEHGGHAELRNVPGGPGAEVLLNLPLSPDPLDPSGSQSSLGALGALGAKIASG